MERLTFSVNLHDSDGDVYAKCILVHLNRTTILRFDDIKAYDTFIEQLQGMREEILENIR